MAGSPRIAIEFLRRAAGLPRITIEFLRRAAGSPRIAYPGRPGTARQQALAGLPATDIVGGVQPLQHATVAHRFPRRNLEWLGAQTSARTRPDGKGAGALGQRAQPPTLPIEHLDLADVTVGVRVELYLRLAGPAAFRHVDHAGRAPDAERGGRRRNLHVPGFCDQTSNKGRRADSDIERRRVVIAALLIDERVDDDASCSRTG